MKFETVAHLVSKTPVKTTYLYGEGRPFSFSITHYDLSNCALPVYYKQPDDQIGLLFLVKGSFDASIQNQLVTIQAGQGILVLEGEILSSGDIPISKCESYGLSFSPKEFLSSGYASEPQEGEVILRNLRKIASRVFNTQKKEMQHCFSNLFLTARSCSEIGHTLMRNRFFTVVTEFSKYGNMPEPHSTPEIQRVLTYIDDNITEPLKISTLVEVSHLSESRFKVKFAEYTGISPHEYVLRKKIEEAKRLLTDPKNSVTQVCYQLSFSSSQYFATVFKRLTSMRPSEYQNFCAINQYGHPWKK